MKAPIIDAAKIAPAWSKFQAALPVKLSTIRSDAEYDRMVVFMNGLLDSVGDDEQHPLADLLALAGQLIEDFEHTRYAIPEALPHEVLRYLMNQHGLTQTDLGAEVGGQSVVSEILSGKRPINARQAKAMAERFGVPGGVFL